MIRIGDTYIRGGTGGNIRDDIIIDIAIVRVQFECDGDIWIQAFEVLDGLFVNGGLCGVRVIFGPEGDLILARSVEGFGHFKGRQILCIAMTAGKTQRQKQEAEYTGDILSHPLVPPLDTPDMIFLRKIRNRIIKGTEMTTTAAIMAGIFSRPKPFSRIS